MKGLKYLERGRREGWVMLMREGVRWVVKWLVEGVGRGGWISRDLERGGGGEGEEMGSRVGCGWICSAGGDELEVADSSVGAEEGICSRGRFVPRGELRVGEGELDWKGRLRHGELDISGSPDDGCVGCESGITLGGVFHESDCVLRSAGPA